MITPKHQPRRVFNCVVTKGTPSNPHFPSVRQKHQDLLPLPGFFASTHGSTVGHRIRAQLVQRPQFWWQNVTILLLHHVAVATNITRTVWVKVGRGSSSNQFILHHVETLVESSNIFIGFLTKLAKIHPKQKWSPTWSSVVGANRLATLRNNWVITKKILSHCRWSLPP